MIKKVKRTQGNKNDALLDFLQNNRSLSCPVCFIQYSRNVRTPMMLCNQQHSICKTCFQEFTKKKSRFQCPLCKLAVYKAKVKRNMFLLQIIQKLSANYADYDSQWQQPQQVFQGQSQNLNNGNNLVSEESEQVVQITSPQQVRVVNTILIRPSESQIRSLGSRQAPINIASSQDENSEQEPQRQTIQSVSNEIEAENNFNPQSNSNSQWRHQGLISQQNTNQQVFTQNLIQNEILNNNIDNYSNHILSRQNSLNQNENGMSQNNIIKIQKVNQSIQDVMNLLISNDYKTDNFQYPKKQQRKQQENMQFEESFEFQISEIDFQVNSWLLQTRKIL